MKIRNIIFDLGGVIIDIDYNLTSQAFKDLGINNFDSLYTKNKQTTLFDDFETGQISSDEFRKRLNAELKTNIDNRKIDCAWNAMLLDIPKQRLEIIKSLKSKYKVFLFSNTNEIHLEKVFNICKIKNNIATFEGYFDKEYYSHILKKRKPNCDAFISILTDNKLKPSETLFIDDSLQHIKGANHVGLYTIHFTPDKSFLSIEQYISDLI